MADTPKTDEVEKAKELLKKEQEETIKKCKIELEQLLEKYKCELQVAMLITPSANIPQITISPKAG